MEKRVELEKRGREPMSITELNLDNCKSPNIAGLTEEFVNLETLSLMNVGLTSLKGFPKLPNLRKLELGKNRISNGLHVLQSSPKLTELSLSSNNIKDLDTLEPLKEFKNLKSLDISNNEAASIENYREKVFNLIPQLKYLDGFDAEDQASDDESEADEEEMNGNLEEASVDGEEGDDDEEDDGDCAEDEDDEDGEDGTDGEEAEDGDLGLEAVYKDDLDEESEGDDYDGEVDDEEDDEDGVEEEEEEDEKEESIVRGKKRKHEDEDEGE